MGRGRRAPEEAVFDQGVVPPALIGHDAFTDLLELLDHIKNDSPATAAAVAQRIDAEIERIGRAPLRRPIDEDVAELAEGLSAHKVTVSGFTIRYVHPLTVKGRPRVLVVSIQRGARVLDQPNYLLRFLAERAKQQAE